MEFKAGDRIEKISGNFTGRKGTVKDVHTYGTLAVIFDGDRIPKYCDPQACKAINAEDVSCNASFKVGDKVRDTSPLCEGKEGKVVIPGDVTCVVKWKDGRAAREWTRCLALIANAETVVANDDVSEFKAAYEKVIPRAAWSHNPIFTRRGDKLCVEVDGTASASHASSFAKEFETASKGKFKMAGWHREPGPFGGMTVEFAVNGAVAANHSPGYNDEDLYADAWEANRGRGGHRVLLKDGEFHVRGAQDGFYEFMKSKGVSLTPKGKDSAGWSVFAINADAAATNALDFDRAAFDSEVDKFKALCLAVVDRAGAIGYRADGIGKIAKGSKDAPRIALITADKAKGIANALSKFLDAFARF